jgi:hypothetical protein
MYYRSLPLVQYNPPPYDALSYAWGSGGLRGLTITLNSVHLEITAELDEALRRLRHPDSKRRLWIDAMCINQGAIAERNVQVA